MNVAIFGLGYVGSVSMACLAREGHNVIGVDINPQKVNMIKMGKPTIIEPGLSQLIEGGVIQGRIKSTNDPSFAIQNSDVSLVCVGTPSKPNGSLETSYAEKVCREIGLELAKKDSYHVIAIRSTILPGTSQERLLPILEEASGKEAGTDFGFCINPEFLREGSAIADFDNPPYTVIGQLDGRSGDVLAHLYRSVDAPIYCVPLGVAEMVKYASNAFHALKIVFANEIGNVCQAYGVDSHEVMDIFAQDTKLNLSPYYLKPGFAFGGSCLGKDLRALLYSARQKDLRIPILESIIPSNELQMQRAFDLVLRFGKRKVGILGLSFKPNTDDLREGPAIELAERLIGKGYELYIYDREVSLGQLHGRNRDYIEKVIPHIGTLMRPTVEETVRSSETLVVTKHLTDNEYRKLIESLSSDHILIDLTRLNGQFLKNFQGTYRGICW
jgi:GDP-mannose 6-dehydrogenase